MLELQLAVTVAMAHSSVPNEAAPMTACCVDIPLSSTPQDIPCKVKDAGTPVGNDGS